MRALHVFPLSGPGSAEAEDRYAHHLTQALRDLGVEVEVLNVDKPSLSLLAKCWAALSRCDIVLMGFAPVPVMSSVMRVARARRKPVVVLPSLTGEPLRDPRPLGRILAAAAAALTVTEESARDLSRLFPKLKIFDIGAGVDPAAFDDSAISGTRFRAKYDLENRQFLFTPGPVHHDLAIEAMYFFPPGSVLLVVADEYKGGKLPSDRVRFLGPLSRTDLRDAYDACDVFVYPAADEKLGGMFLEAWARGKPVIGNPNSYTVSSLIDDAVDGFLCDNSRTISRRVELLLEHPALCRKMGDKGRRKLLEHHTWEQVATRVRGAYESIAAKCAIPKERQG
jgi:glycosyltransferase involved in cell wall biosynthesis